MLKLLKYTLLSFLAFFFLSVIYVFIFEPVTAQDENQSVTDPGNVSIDASQVVTEQQTKSLYEQAQTETLGWYRKLTKAQRQEVVANMYARTDTNGTADDFYSMMGDMAYNKSQTVKFADVWRWCVTEAEMKPERFKNHFNGMEEMDLRDKAYYACQELVKNNLLAPYSAVFPDNYNVITHGHDKYTIIAYVDSQNRFGAMLRKRWECATKYQYGSWESEVKFEE